MVSFSRHETQVISSPLVQELRHTHALFPVQVVQHDLQVVDELLVAEAEAALEPADKQRALVRQNVIAVGVILDECGWIRQRPPVPCRFCSSEITQRFASPPASSLGSDQAFQPVGLA